MADHAHSHDHGGAAAKYVQVAVILFALTALEVLLYEVCYGSISHHATAMAESLSPWFVEILLALSALKFWYVAMFYMHLKMDIRFLGWMFYASVLVAGLILSGLIALFVYNRGLWWATGVW